jgi:UDP-N-acetylmuramoyl-L-alanyl-D-glutamate--2,6-diaminopimelate ligase
VFGCGGDRDRTKRPIMGRIAAELSDQVIVTSDNPRSENPATILADIVAGIPAERAEAVRTEVDRRTAIREAVALAQPGDLVVIAGKGHETYQIFAHETIHFDDREEARAAIHDREQA